MAGGRSQIKTEDKKQVQKSGQNIRKKVKKCEVKKVDQQQVEATSDGGPGWRRNTHKVKAGSEKRKTN